MARTIINVYEVTQAKNKINSAKTTVSSVKSSFAQTKANVDSKIQNRSNIRNRLNSVNNQLTNIINRIYQIQSTVQSSANKYQNTDNNINAMKSKDIEGVLFNVLETTGSILREQFKELYDSVKENINNGIKAEIEKSKSEEVLPSFKEYNLIYDFIESRNPTIDAILFGVTRADLFAGIKSLFNSSVGRDNMIDNVYKNQIISIIEQANAQDKYVEVGKELLLEYQNKVIDPVNNWNVACEIISNNSEKYKYLEKFDEESFKKLGTLLKYGQEGVETIEILLNDYSSTLESLESLKKGLEITGGNELIIDYIDELIFEYNNKFGLVVDNVVDFAFDEAIDLGGETLSMATPGNLLSYANSAHEIIWNVGGLEEKGDILASLYASNQYSDDVVIAYEHYANKLRSGQYTEEDYSTCKNLFLFVQEMKIQEYQNIKVFSTKDSYDYIDEQIVTLNSLQMNFN